jgi:thiol-disulfide isomerase/thioredoxin
LIEKARAFFFTEAATFTDVKTPDGKGMIASKAVNELRRLDNLPNLKVGGIAPEITGTDLDGKSLKLSDYRGKVVVVVFWGSWCGPCMAMVPNEKELWERHKDKPFALFGVNCGDTLEVAKKTATEKGIAWPSWYSGEETRGDIAIEYDVQQWPTVYVIDAKGVIRFIDAREKELEKAVESLLAEMK